MSIRPGSAFRHRCFYLLAGLLLLLAVTPFVHTPGGAAAANVLNAIVVVTAVVAAGRSRRALWVAAALAVPTLALQFAGLLSDDRRILALSHLTGVALYLVAVGYLLRYVLRPDVLTVDKLYGGAATYLLMGVVWAYLYAIVQYLEPGSFAFGGASASLNFRELVYFSFTTLTTVGFGDFTAARPLARMIVVFEEIVGVLYVAILIARLAGSYSPSETER